MSVSIPMDVKPLVSIAQRQAVIGDWLKNGLRLADADSITEDMLAEGSSLSGWYGVLDNNSGMIIAVFDVRQVPLESPDFHKSMRIHFAPGLNPQDWENVGQPPEKIADIIDKTVAESTKEHRVKIYSDHPLRLLIFQKFAENLVKEAPTAYGVRTYKKMGRNQASVRRSPWFWKYLKACLIVLKKWPSTIRLQPLRLHLWPVMST